MVSVPTADLAIHFRSHLHSCMPRLLVAPNSSHPQEASQQLSGLSAVESPSELGRVGERRNMSVLGLENSTTAVGPSPRL